MNCRKITLACLFVASSLLISGCATHTANDKNHTVVLGGLFESQEGAYEKQPASTLPLNGEKPVPGSSMNGTKVSILWGLISYRNQ